MIKDCKMGKAYVQGKVVIIIVKAELKEFELLFIYRQGSG